eukprot:jgi/Mesvir1/22704/Mv14119-RA.1
MADVMLKVTYNLSHAIVTVPPNATIGDVKDAAISKNLIAAGTCKSDLKLLFRGREKQDEDSLQAAGVKHLDKLMLVEKAEARAARARGRDPKPVVEEADAGEQARAGAGPIRTRELQAESDEEHQNRVASDAVRAISRTVDSLEEKLDTLERRYREANGNGDAGFCNAGLASPGKAPGSGPAAPLSPGLEGTTKDMRDLAMLSEMLTQQLLRLDGIQASGTARVLRKSEVNRIEALSRKIDSVMERSNRRRATS